MRADPKSIFIGLVVASLTSAAPSVEMNGAAINSAEPSKKTLSSAKPTPGCRPCSTGCTSRRARSTASSERIAKKALRAYAEAQQLPNSDEVAANVSAKLTSATVQ
jgi:hypothetical protein